MVADEQTGGKGRRGRAWCTPKGSAIAMTIVLRPDIRPELASMVTLVMGLSVAKAIGSLYPVSVGIKWPNDVVVNGKKICGILTEMSAEMTGIHYLVIGTGINTNVEEFPEEIQSVATSLIKELGEKVNRAELIAACLKYFEEYYEKYIAAGNLAPLKEDYEALLLNRNNKVRVLEPNHEYTGLSLGINEDGELLGGKRGRHRDGRLCRRGVRPAAFTDTFKEKSESFILWKKQKMSFCARPAPTRKNII